MQTRLLTLESADWAAPGSDPAWIEAVEDGQVLYFPRLSFALSPGEQALLGPALLQPGVRNISLDAAGQLKGVAGEAPVQAQARALIERFAAQSLQLVHTLFPKYQGQLRLAPTSLRPVGVSNRRQSWRADDRRLHVDAFPSRPNRGERILRVFSNINPHGQPRVWRIGEPFGDVARRFLPVARRYSPLQARLLRALGVTKSLRSEYDHLMLQLHDLMKADAGYQAEAPQQTMEFPPGSTWVCFSDQTVHAAMSGQHMIERTFHLPVASQYNREASPLAILTRLAGHPLI
ncbi:Kdo hydroxylase family protein [Caenimonas terrae]|uniref:Kdo hydroxylase family protein n=1 Tax=Caenimonas terrae TaxID=696074 RepID=A0ABW0ND84_9BURK